MNWEEEENAHLAWLWETLRCTLTLIVTSKVSSHLGYHHSTSKFSLERIACRYKQRQ